ncbi:uroporphyrinogen-III synthase [Scaptodrosophila lebanonensis]|uniref:Uroporphyrinogen-III synthase n=1 Tax=Drosophila lebanonensis TaxID=7225 RepID=A0A6J2TFA7_DROLE|nr:uroporphyrinogen-III synthase [Scaptodrosophila lebanonensis]
MGDSAKRTVLLFPSETIAKSNADLFVKALHFHDFEAICVPPVHFVYKNLSQLRAKLQTPENYGGIIFSSPRCVEAVAEALQQAPLSHGWKLLRNYSMGEVTHNLAYKALQQLCTIGKASNNASNLCNLIMDTYAQEPELPFLLPCGNMVGNAVRLKLLQVGYSVDACEVFECKCHPRFSALMKSALDAGKMEFLVFFSPASVPQIVGYFKANLISLAKCKVIGVGSITRKALEREGLKVHHTIVRPIVEELLGVMVKTNRAAKI